MLSWRGPGHPRAGGAELYTARVLSGLAARGHSTVWCCEGARGAPPPGVRVVAAGAVPALYAAGARFVRRHAGAYDVVVDQVNTCGFLAPLYCPVPVVACVHQLAREVWRYEAHLPGRLVGPALEALLLRAYRRVPFITVSRTTLGDLRAAGWCGPATVAYNGVDPPAAAPPPKERAPTLVFLARFPARAKRLAHALAAFAHLRAAVPQARLWVIGRGRPTLGPPAGVRFFPDAEDAERDALLARAWLLVATSVREGWGRMVLEAAAAGTPALVYAVPGLAEAAEMLGGAAVAPEPAALAEASERLLRAPDRLHEMGERARALAAEFTWERAVSAWEQALAAAAAGGAGGPSVRAGAGTR